MKSRETIHFVGFDCGYFTDARGIDEFNVNCADDENGFVARLCPVCPSHLSFRGHFRNINSLSRIICGDCQLSKPTKEDAQLLLQLEQMLLMEPNQRALHWFWRVFYPRKISDISKIREIYPSNSEGSMYLDRLSAFWESAGALVNNGLLNERLFFDRFLVKPYWEALKIVLFADREDTKEPRIGENFELLAKKEAAWRESTPPK